VSEKTKDPKPALDVLQSLLEKGTTPLAADFKRYQLKLDWASIVGATIAERCSPVAYSKGVLHIWVSNAAWLNQLFFVRQEILKKVNKYAGDKWAKEIRFTQDKKDIPEEVIVEPRP
jgi:predicted nucleic acid-binding Zn ribbon protein